MTKMVANPRYLMTSQDFKSVLDHFVLDQHSDKNYVFDSVALYRPQLALYLKKGNVSGCFNALRKYVSGTAHRAIAREQFSQLLRGYRDNGDVDKLLVEACFESQRREGYGHATALCVDFEKRAIFFQDSQGDPIRKHFLNPLKSIFPDFSFTDYKVKQQRDFWSCTFYAFENLRKMASDKPIDADIDIMSVREEAQSYLQCKWDALSKEDQNYELAMAKVVRRYMAYKNDPKKCLDVFFDEALTVPYEGENSSFECCLEQQTEILFVPHDFSWEEARAE